MLGSLLTDLTICNLHSGAQLQLWHDIKKLTSLTRLTIDDHRGAFDDSSFYDMQELCYLPNMHTLVWLDYTSLATKVVNYTSLQCLELRGGEDPVCDLSCCTGLTALVYSAVDTPLRRIILPHGEGVCLQDLEINMYDELYNGQSDSASSDDNDAGSKGYELVNLNMALQLTSLSLQGALRGSHSGTLRGVDWPRKLPALETLQLRYLCGYPPREMCLYSKLKHLDLSNIHVDTLPDWFSGLTQLQELVMKGSRFFHFPESLVALSQLQRLIMCDMHSVCLPDSILKFAQWPNLSVLDLTISKHQQHTLDSHLNLLLLQNAFKSRGTRSPLVTNDIYRM